MIDNQKDLARPTYVAKGLAKDDISSLKCTTATPQPGPKASAPCVLGEAADEAADTQMAAVAPTTEEWWIDTPTTQLANPFPVATAADCANVLDWNFFHSTVTANNLGGVGPNKSDNEEIRFAAISDGIDLVLTTNKPYKPNDTGKKPGEDNNGISGKFGVVNIKGGTEVAMQFTLVEAGTDIPVVIAKEQKVFFSVYDLDRDKALGPEYVKFTTEVDSYKVTATSTAKVTGTKKNLVATAGRVGNGADNPTDPLHMSQVQKDSAVWVTYKGKNTWGMTFGESGNPKGKAGRNLLFAGRAEGDCPPGDVKPAPGECTADGAIQGIIKGGGRVCCPAKCGDTSGEGQKWADAPNACGGPGCDKGPDGKRVTYRYDNCCVGKPIYNGNVRESITADYGIVSQGRFCTGLGKDPPPCINKLSRDSDRL